ncbi:ABC transporter permease [Clostridium grantii]|uniref:FtsX-like permease family protein n=1 Tax=Clostridium grantii DSM 8605 TaxID=1121316 RepID=A0A1M5Y0I2_9CLOT|nr:ABC transporter permease [Clostridium grantii]SHI05571.1 FtsX-like permease family protein [Clostridium grantii DSM 8605]
MNALPLLKIALQNDMRNAAYGNDFVVSAQENALFSLDEIRTEGKVAGILNYYGIINDKEEKKCDIVGADYSIVEEVFDIQLESGEDLGMSTDGVVITKWFADKMNLNQGDKLHVVINQKEYSFIISAIAFNKGLFKDNTYLIMIKKSELDSILGTSESDVNRAYIYECDANTSTKDIELLNNLQITKVVDEEFINSEISMYGIMMVFILIFVFFIAFYIIYNIYNTFVIERGKYIGTLRSCGATKRKIRNVFVAANTVITIISGFIGVLLAGITICAFACKVMSINYIKTEFPSMVMAFGITMLFSLILGSISIIIPLNNILKFSERALLNGEIERNRKKKIIIPALSFVLTCFFWIFTSFKSTGSLFTEFVIFIIFIATSILSIRFIIFLMDKLLGKTIGKGAFLIALKNVIHNIYVRKNITIIAILTILMILVGNLSYSILKGLANFYNNYKCNAYFDTSVSFNDDELNQLSKIEGLNEYFPNISKRMVINNTDEVSCFIENEPEKLSEEFLEFNIQWKDFDKEKFSKGKYCIITDIFSKRHNLNVGEYINISRHGVEAQYCIAAISYTIMQKGKFIFISEYDLPFKDCTNYNFILVDCKDISGFYDKLQITFPDRKIYFTSVEDKIKEDKENSKGLSTMFFAFSIFVVLIGIQGIYNNFKLGYINRKKEFAIMISNGYRLQDLFLILFMETVICSLLGGIISIIYMFFYRKEISNIMFLMDLPVPLLNNIWIILIPILLCIAASLVSIFITCRQLKKIEKNIINVLKI